jgi:hypothetical protein
MTESGNRGRASRSPWAAVALVAAACGGSNSAGAPVPAHAAVEGLTGRRCQYVAHYDSTPSLSSLTRAGTLGNISLWGREQGPADTVEVSIRYGYDGRLDWVEPIRATGEPGRIRELANLILEAVPGSGTPDWGVRVLVVGGAVLRTEPSVVCAARRVGGSSVWAADANVRYALADFFRSHGGRYPVRVALDEQGRVMDVVLVRRTYSRWMDQFIIDYVRSSTFDAKLFDGIGVPATFELQLRLPRG